MSEIPHAPGAYHEDLTDLKKKNAWEWGISMVDHGDEAYLVR